MVPETTRRSQTDAPGSTTRRQSRPAPWTRSCRGTAAGLELLLNICAMLIVLVALVHLANAMLGLLPEHRRRADHAAALLGYRDGAGLLADGHAVERGADRRRLMGIKTILNEFIAYVELSKLPSGRARSRARA